MRARSLQRRSQSGTVFPHFNNRRSNSTGKGSMVILNKSGRCKINTAKTITSRKTISKSSHGAAFHRWWEHLVFFQVGRGRFIHFSYRFIDSVIDEGVSPVPGDKIRASRVRTPRQHQGRLRNGGFKRHPSEIHKIHLARRGCPVRHGISLSQ